VFLPHFYHYTLLQPPLQHWRQSGRMTGVNNKYIELLSSGPHFSSCTKGCHEKLCLKHCQNQDVFWSSIPLIYQSSSHVKKGFIYNKNNNQRKSSLHPIFFDCSHFRLDNFNCSYLQVHWLTFLPSPNCCYTHLVIFKFQTSFFTSIIYLILLLLIVSISAEISYPFLSLFWGRVIITA